MNSNMKTDSSFKFDFKKIVFCILKKTPLGGFVKE